MKALACVKYRLNGDEAVSGAVIGGARDVALVSRPSSVIGDAVGSANVARGTLGAGICCPMACANADVGTDCFPMACMNADGNPPSTDSVLGGVRREYS